MVKAKKKPTSKSVNTQSVDFSQGSTTDSINNQIDFTDNLFYQIMHANGQDSINSAYIPNVKGLGMDSSSTSFVVPTLVSNGEDTTRIKTKALMDTGAMISTISRTEADRLGLDIKPAPPIRITYGNKSKGMSASRVWFAWDIQSQSFRGDFLRVVSKQNHPIILGMDWMRRTKILLDPIYKTVVPRSAHLNTSSTPQQDVWHDVPNEVKKKSLQLMTKRPNNEASQPFTTTSIEHCIDTRNTVSRTFLATKDPHRRITDDCQYLETVAKYFEIRNLKRQGKSSNQNAQTVAQNDFDPTTTKFYRLYHQEE